MKMKMTLPVKMEPFPQQVGDGSETSCPTLSEASSDLFSYEFFCGLLNGTGFGTGAWPTSHGSSNATGRHQHAVVFFEGLWLATNLLHVFSSGRSFLADLAQVLGEIPSAKLRF